MPLIVVCGQPSSGKSTVTARLLELLQPSYSVHIVDEPSLHLHRNTAYQSSVEEKKTRGALKSAVERTVSKKTIVILDSLNNIKGYRYELWCVARSAGTRYCMVHVDTPVDTCRQWNSQRQEDQQYSEAVFNDLAGRFEMPDSRNRWDAPLFTVRPGSGDEAAVLAAIAAAATGVPVHQQQPAAAAAADLQSPGPDLEGYTPEHQLLHQGQMVGELKPNIATTNPALLGTNVLHDIDRAVQDVISRLLEVQQLSPENGISGSLINLGQAGKLQLIRQVTLAELRRHKRAFLKLATKMTYSRLQDPAAAQRLFVDYLKQQLLGTMG